MDFMNKLLDGVEVEWKSIEEITTDRFWIMPSTPKFSECGEIPYITSKNIRNGHINFDKTKLISRSDYLNLSRNRAILKGDILISMIGTIGEVARVKYTDLEFYGQNMYLIRLNENLINSCFFLHFFDSQQIKNHFNSVKNNSGQGFLKSKDIEKLLIPIPPLHIQEEIVRILDTFTELTAELTAELTMRKQQYEYYRERLLTFGEEIPIFQLNEVAQYSKDRINAIQVDKTTYIGVDNLLQDRQGKTDSNYVPTEGKLTRYEKNNILIGNIRPYLKKIWFSDTCGGTNGDVLVIQLISDKLLPKYLYVLLCTEKFFNYNMQNAKGAKMPRGNKDVIMRYSFHLPSLEEQQRIVDILDRFDTLCNDLSQGLPAEIKMRQQQYEYYRNKLLTFEKEKV